MMTMPRVGPPHSVRIGAARHQDASVGLQQALRRAAVTEIRSQGEIERQGLTAGKIQIERQSGIEIELTGFDDVAGQIDNHQHIDIELSQSDGRDVISREGRVVILDEAISIGPITPVGGRHVQTVECRIRERRRSGALRRARRCAELPRSSG